MLISTQKMATHRAEGYMPLAPLVNITEVIWILLIFKERDGSEVTQLPLRPIPTSPTLN